MSPNDTLYPVCELDHASRSIVLSYVSASWLRLTLVP
jgi:hypothetical protein